MSTDCGVVRAAPGLMMAAETLADLARLADDLPPGQIATYEVINLVRVSRAIVAAALAREESRGSHTRSDAPGADDRWLGRLVIQGDAAPRFVELPALAREAT
jgi:L-aspartate oxidase